MSFDLLTVAVLVLVAAVSGFLLGCKHGPSDLRKGGRGRAAARDEETHDD